MGVGNKKYFAETLSKDSLRILIMITLELNTEQFAVANSCQRTSKRPVEDLYKAEELL